MKKQAVCCIKLLTDRVVFIKIKKYYKKFKFMVDFFNRMLYNNIVADNRCKTRQKRIFGYADGQALCNVVP